MQRLEVDVEVVEPIQGVVRTEQLEVFETAEAGPFELAALEILGVVLADHRGRDQTLKDGQAEAVFHCHFQVNLLAARVDRDLN